jgi:hypothetical protein
MASLSANYIGNMVVNSTTGHVTRSSELFHPDDHLRLSNVPRLRKVHANGKAPPKLSFRVRKVSRDEDVDAMTPSPWAIIALRSIFFVSVIPPILSYWATSLQLSILHDIQREKRIDGGLFTAFWVSLGLSQLVLGTSHILILPIRQPGGLDAVLCR